MGCLGLFLFLSSCGAADRAADAAKASQSVLTAMTEDRQRTVRLEASLTDARTELRQLRQEILALRDAQRANSP